MLGPPEPLRNLRRHGRGLPGFAPDSLTHLYTPDRNREEVELNKISSLQVDHEWRILGTK